MSREWASGNLYIRPSFKLPKGHTTHTHRHNFDHTTIVWEGAIHVKEIIDDEITREQDFKRSEFFLVKANAKHEITVLEDGTTYWCVYAHRNPQGEIVQEYDGWFPAYDAVHQFNLK